MGADRRARDRQQRRRSTATGLRLRRGGWGAFRVALRYHELQIDDLAFTLDLAAQGASGKAQAVTAGLRWYLTGNLWYTLNFETHRVR